MSGGQRRLIDGYGEKLLRKFRSFLQHGLNRLPFSLCQDRHLQLKRQQLKLRLQVKCISKMQVPKIRDYIAIGIKEGGYQFLHFRTHLTAGLL